ncbi:MAG TPA: YIP1 family protein [Verrucomicrobiae bacterium]|nr:YIP1 family protein [Verrucomicrobiae bacterium]
MIKALLLIFEPVAAWNRIALARRSLFFMVFLYLLPMMLIVAVAEAFGLVEWGREQHLLGGIHLFPIREAVALECTEMVLMGLAIVVCAYLVKSFGETFHLRNTYQQAFTVVIYGLSPLFLFRLLDVTPALNPWIVWAVGVFFSVRTLYIGVPRVMEPDPPHALGLFFMSGLVVTLATAGERLISTGYLSGRFRPVSDVLYQILMKYHLLK